MLDREYYTVSEAADYLASSEGDLYHYLETGQLEAAILSPRRQFYLVGRNEGRSQWEGRGTVYYRGLLLPEKKWISALLENKEIVLDESALPLKPNEYSDFSAECPFSEGVLPSNIEAWKPGKSDYQNLFICPLPSQTISGAYTLAGVLGALSAFGKHPYPLEHLQGDSGKYKFDYEQNGKYRLEDLRLTRSVVAQLDQRRPGAISGEPLKHGLPTENLEHLPWCESKSKPRRIDEVIERLFRHQGDIPAKLLWKALEEDQQKERPLYDTEDIIDEVSMPSIQWCNLEGNICEFKYKTFQNKLSQIRVFYISNHLI